MTMLPPNRLQWIPDRDGNYPANALVVGTHCFSIRANHECDLIPGKLEHGQKEGYVSCAGEDHPCKVYEVLCDFTPKDIPPSYKWVPASDSVIPPNSIPMGRTRTGDLLFVARGYHDGKLIAGKMHKGHRCAYVPYQGQEIALENYEVLVVEDV